MKRDLRTLLLIPVMLAGFTLSAQASALFPPAAVYDGQFVDIRPDNWFYANVVSL